MSESFNTFNIQDEAGLQKSPATHFAPPERADQAEIMRQALSISQIPNMSECLNSTQEFVLILNAQRQIVFASNNVLPLVGGNDLAPALGLRPGEALGCVHASTCTGGCGTSRACRVCGAVTVILDSLRGRKNLAECRMTRIVDGQRQSLDLRVKGTPFTHKQESYTILTVCDIAHEKRRHQLEDVFLRGLMRDIFTLNNLVQTARGEMPQSQRANAKGMNALTAHVSRMTEYVLMQHDLAEVEKRSLSPAFTRINPDEFLRSLIKKCEARAAARNLRLHLDALCSTQLFHSDHALLMHVLDCLLTNAIEAGDDGETIALGVNHQGELITFWVHNDSAMPEDVQLQVFNRSFSIKSTHRGLGTYTARLLTEQYLFGKVRFISNADVGTTFFVELPVTPKSCEAGPGS